MQHLLNTASKFYYHPAIKGTVLPFGAVIITDRFLNNILKKAMDPQTLEDTLKMRKISLLCAGGLGVLVGVVGNMPFGLVAASVTVAVGIIFYFNKGRVVFANGNVYEGQWKKGKFHGQGKLTQSDGTWFEGEWRDGDPWNGYGMCDENEGEWRNGTHRFFEIAYFLNTLPGKITTDKDLENCTSLLGGYADQLSKESVDPRETIFLLKKIQTLKQALIDEYPKIEGQGTASQYSDTLAPKPRQESLDNMMRAAEAFEKSLYRSLLSKVTFYHEKALEKANANIGDNEEAHKRIRSYTDGLLKNRGDVLVRNSVLAFSTDCDALLTVSERKDNKEQGHFLVFLKNNKWYSQNQLKNPTQLHFQSQYLTRKENYEIDQEEFKKAKGYDSLIEFMQAYEYTPVDNLPEQRLSQYIDSLSNSPPPEPSDDTGI